MSDNGKLVVHRAWKNHLLPKDLQRESETDEEMIEVPRIHPEAVKYTSGVSLSMKINLSERGLSEYGFESAEVFVYASLSGYATEQELVDELTLRIAKARIKKEIMAFYDKKGDKNAEKKEEDESDLPS